jgi:hypothetical protein
VAPLAFVFMAAFYVTPTRLPFLLEGLGVSNTLAVGSIMATLTLVSMPLSLSYGRIRSFASAFAVFAFSFVFMGAGLVAHSLATGWGGVLLGSALAGCIVVPQTREVYDPECRLLTRQMTLQAAYVGGFQSCAGEGCLALLSAAGAVTAVSAVVSGSNALVGTVVYWFERQGQCLRAPVPVPPVPTAVGMAAAIRSAP